jgi:hypothetical protein
MKLNPNSKLFFLKKRKRFEGLNKIPIITLAIFIIITLFLVSPVSAKVFVTDQSHGLMTAPAAAYTNNQLILSSITPEKAVTNYLTGKDTIIVGTVSLSGTKISARTSSLAKYWNQSDVVVLGTGNDISAAYIAIKNNAPLLIAGTTLPDATKTELTRLKPKKIIICASTSAIPDSILSSFKTTQKQRIWYGSDNSTFSNSQKLYPNNGTIISAPKSLMPVAMAMWKNATFVLSDKVMINNNATIWSSNNIITSIAMNRYVKNDLPVIYITCDNMVSKTADQALLAKIKAKISSSANVIIDPNSPGPGEANRAINKAPSGIGVFMGATCAGTMYDTISGVKGGYLKSAASDLNGLVYINYGTLNLANTTYIGRAWDDNFSSVYFAGIYYPAKYLKSANIGLVEAKIGTTTEEQRINKIAQYLIDYSYNANKEHLISTYNTSFVAKHQINPTTLSTDAKNILNGTPTTINKEKWIYLSAQYIAGLPISSTAPTFYSATNTTPVFSGTITRNEYREMAKKVYEYMKINKKVPNSVTVNGKTLKSADYIKLFAQLISTHTDKKYMTFPVSIKLNSTTPLLW